MNNTESQDSFIQNLIDTKTETSIFLVNGIKLTGQILAADRFTILISGFSTSDPQMIYKHAISTIGKAGKFRPDNQVNRSPVRRQREQS